MICKTILEQKEFMERLYPNRHLKVVLSKDKYYEMATEAPPGIYTSPTTESGAVLFGMPVYLACGEDNVVSVECLL